MKKVRINQTGYLPKTIKYAVFADLSPEDDSFKVIEKTTGKVVFEGEISKQKEFKTSGEANSTGYFTEVETAGTYIIETGKGEKSNEFVIGDNVYDKLLLDVFRVLYLQRCGVELPESLAGIYAHPACHTQIGHIHGTDKTLDVSGGWHDAGDYGRYIVSAAKTVADLFIAYNVNPALFTDEMNIPESGNGISDLLDEARFELEWMLKMQDEVTGGAYHKVTGYSFPAFIMPEEESWDMVICPVSNTATADFAATMALAYTMYKDVDGAFADMCLAAAKRAYDYVAAHKDEPGFKNPEDVFTGEYPDSNCFDEILWAAAELYKVTEDDRYFELMEECASKISHWTLLGWEDMGGYAAYSILTCKALKKNRPYFVQNIEEKFFAQVDKMVAASKANPYFIDRDESFEWGSNMGIADNGMIFWMANSLKPNEDYAALMRANLDYLLGANALDICFVTGFGSNSPKHPHHRPSGARKAAMPGMLVGGPDSGLHDPTAEEHLTGAAPAKCYVDIEESYSTNEICVYWNSPLIALLAMCL